MWAEAQRLKDPRPPGWDRKCRAAPPTSPSRSRNGGGVRKLEKDSEENHHQDCHSQVHSYRRFIRTDLGPCLGRNRPASPPPPASLPARPEVTWTPNQKQPQTSAFPLFTSLGQERCGT